MTEFDYRTFTPLHMAADYSIKVEITDNSTWTIERAVDKFHRNSTFYQGIRLTSVELADKWMTDNSAIIPWGNFYWYVIAVQIEDHNYEELLVDFPDFKLTVELNLQNYDGNYLLGTPYALFSDSEQAMKFKLKYG